MTGLRVIMLVVGMLIAAPFIALNIWGIQMSLWVNEMTAQNEALINGSTEEVELPPMPGNPLSRIRNRVEVRDMFSKETISGRRYIGIEEIVAFEDLLAPGEALPAEELHELYATARAPARLMPYCAEVLATVGTACDVIHADVRMNRTGKYELSGRLGFTPRADFGDPSSVDNGDIITARISLPYEGDLRPANDVETRQSIMQEAQTICDTLRAQLGNCVLSRVAFDVRELWVTDLEALPAGTNPQRLDVSVRVAVYADKTELDHRGLQDLLEQMINPS